MNVSLEKKVFSIIYYQVNKKIPDTTQARKHYELFLKTKAKKIHKTSKTVKNQKYVSKKSITLRQTKTTNVLKPIIQSIIISQAAETVEKSNIFLHRLSYYKTSKICYQIIKAKNDYSTSKQKKNLYRVKSD